MAWRPIARLPSSSGYSAGSELMMVQPAPWRGKRAGAARPIIYWFRLDLVELAGLPSYIDSMERLTHSEVR